MTISAVLAVLFTATLVHASLGFGTALVSMPLLVILLGFQVATPLVGLAATVTVMVVLGREWRNMDVRSAWQLIAASLIGIPIGLILLRAAPEYLVKTILGVTLVGYGIYNLAKPELP
ncbi:MAG: sulfite exporter TauE/SafE family protein, partial [Gammaproteobacteria bacterium]|nr:sulfite exporter TauE/SafE family protein [Gammaproteobacteria bacterium]